MSEHTPGPWEATERGLILGSEEVWTNGAQRNALGIASASYSKCVATIDGDVTLPAPKANANLIIAAPDLLEACEKAQADIQRRESATISTKTWQAIREAIQKAKGE